MAARPCLVAADIQGWPIKSANKTANEHLESSASGATHRYAAIALVKAMLRTSTSSHAPHPEEGSFVFLIKKYELSGVANPLAGRVCRCKHVRVPRSAFGGSFFLVPDRQRRALQCSLEFRAGA